MKKIILPLFVFFIVLMTACEKETIQQPEEDFQTDSPDIVLGKRLENPYTVENMQKAYNNLKNTGTKSAPDIEITATHLYVKFKPKNEEELRILESDSTLIIYDIPLDYEIVQNSDYYHDPTLPKDQPTYQYASVKIDQELPSEVDYEILSELFIPDEYKTEEPTSLTKAVKALKNTDLIEQLVDEALRITNNMEKKAKPSTRTKGWFSRRSKWRPAGRIQVWDDKIGQSTTTKRVFSHWEYYDCDDDHNPREERTIEQQYRLLLPNERCKRAVYKYISTTSNGSYVPVEGARVRARRWFTTHTGIADSKGYYSCNGRFRRDANYKIKWKRADFSIWWSYLSSAKYNGPKRKGDWNLNIKKGTHQQYYATIFRGAHLYYYGDMFGLTRPPKKRWGLRRLVINARKKTGQSNYVKARRLILAADISLLAWGENTDKIFGTTIHELAHAAHREVDKSAYNSLVWKGYTSPCGSGDCDDPGTTGANARRLMETWATTVEYFIVKQRYENYYNVQGFNYTNGYNYRQERTINQNNFYTSCGIDMMDDFNQRDHKQSSAYPIDRVKAYTITQLEDALKDATTWNRWKTNLINDYNNPTERYLDELFANWTN